MKKVTITLVRDGVLVYIPLKLLTGLLKPRVMFESIENLTPREEQVLERLLRALPNKQIASEMNLSERTIKFHVSSLLAKTRMKTRSDLQVMYANLQKNKTLHVN